MVAFGFANYCFDYFHGAGNAVFQANLPAKLGSLALYCLVLDGRGDGGCQFAGCELPLGNGFGANA